LTRGSALQFPDGHICNHRIIVSSFVEKGSGNQKEVISTSFFVKKPRPQSLNGYYLWLQLFHFQHHFFSKSYNPTSQGLGEMWSIELFGTFIVGFCGSRSVKGFVKILFI
jgi:hypothetical protein